MHLLHLILSYLLPHAVLLAGTVAVPAFGGDTGTADTAGTEGTTETETTTEGTEGGDGESTEGGEGTEPDAQVAPIEGKVDWRSVPAEVKAHLQEISKANPKLGNLLQNAVYTSQSFVKQFPQGIKEAVALKKVVDDAGGPEEIQNIRQTYQNLQDEQEDLDNKARTGDISVLDNLIEISGDGFGKLMPTAIDKWAAADPAGYSHVIGKVMVNALSEGGVIANLNMAVQMLGLENGVGIPQGIKALQAVADWVNKVGQTAKTPPAKAAVDPQIAEQQRKIDSDKTEIFNSKFVTQFQPWRDSQIRAQLTLTAPKGKTFSDYQVKALGDNVIEEMKSILLADSDYNKNINRLYAARDLDAMVQFSRSRTQKLLPEVVKKVYKQLFSDPAATTKKVVPTKVAPKVGADGKPIAAAAPPVKGWVKVAADKAPHPDLIDNGKTDFQMKYNRQAILKDGRKVYWGSKVPAA